MSSEADATLFEQYLTLQVQIDELSAKREELRIQLSKPVNKYAVPSVARNKFESWYKTKYPFFSLMKRDDGNYASEHAFNAWDVWKAAIETHSSNRW